MHIRTLIVEDEPLSRQFIGALLGNIPNIEIIATAATEKEAIEKINLLEPDLILLDLELHTGTGLEVIRNIVSTHASIIFTTALDHQATCIIRISGMPFLQKPIDAQELETLIGLTQNRSNALKEKQFNYLLETLENKNLPLHIYLIEEAVEEKTAINDIVFIQSEDKKCAITLSDGTSFQTSLSIKEFEEMLCGFNFFRINATTIVNMNFVNFKKQSGDTITLNSGLTMDLSMKKRAAFMQKEKEL